MPKQIYDSEYQLIGRTVLRAEKDKKDVELAKENFLKQKKNIYQNSDAELMGLDSGEHGNIINKRSAPQYTGVPAYTQIDSNDQTPNK